MDKRAARKLAARFGVTEMHHGDRVVSPRGEEIYKQPLIMPGQQSFAFTLDGSPVGVVIVRRGDGGFLRYCDREGRVHQEQIMADTTDQTMAMAVNRMAVVVGAMMGERHPLAEATSANRTPA